MTVQAIEDSATVGIFPKSQSNTGLPLSAWDMLIMEVERQESRSCIEAAVRANILQKQEEQAGNDCKPETWQYLINDKSIIQNGYGRTFNYSTEAMLRRAPDDRSVSMPADTPQSLWRQHTIHSASAVYITENELNAISLINLGIEQLPKVAVVAVPFGSALKKAWGRLFSGKMVIIAYSNRGSRREERERLASIVRPYADEYYFFNWEEIEG